MRLRRWEPGLEVPVDEQAPDLLERDVPHELLDVETAVAQASALAVGLGDLGGEGEDAFHAGLGLGHVMPPGTAARARCRRAFATLPHPRIEHQRRRPAGELS